MWALHSLPPPLSFGLRKRAAALHCPQWNGGRPQARRLAQRRKSLPFCLQYPAKPPEPINEITLFAVEEYEGHFGQLQAEFPECWHHCGDAEDRCRDEALFHIRRDLERFHAEGRKMPGITFNCVSRGPQSSRRLLGTKPVGIEKSDGQLLLFLHVAGNGAAKQKTNTPAGVLRTEAQPGQGAGSWENKTSKDQRGGGAEGSKGSGRLAHRSPVTREFAKGCRGACVDVCQAHVCQYCLQPHPNSECDPMTKRRQAGQVTFQAQDLWQHGQGHGHRDQGQGAHRHRLRQGQRGHWREWQDELQDAPGTGAVPGLGHIWHGRRAEHGSTHARRVKQWRSSPPAAATTAALALSGPRLTSAIMYWCGDKVIRRALFRPWHG